MLIVPTSIERTLIQSSVRFVTKKIFLIHFVEDGYKWLSLPSVWWDGLASGKNKPQLYYVSEQFMKIKMLAK